MVVSCSLFELLAFFLSIPFACRLVPLLILCMALSGFTLCLCSCCPSLPSVSRCCGSSGRGVSSSCRLSFLSGCPGWHKPALPRTMVLFPSVHRCCRVHDAPSVCHIRDMRPVYCVVAYQHQSYSLNYVLVVLGRPSSKYWYMNITAPSSPTVPIQTSLPLFSLSMASILFL